MKRVRADQENLYQLVEVLDVLKIGIDTYKKGNKAAWMIVSAYLNQLLTDNSRGKPLALRVMPLLDFHPILNPVIDKDESGSPIWLLNCPVNISFNKNDIKLEIFDMNRKRVKLNKWLQQIIYVQPFNNQGIPIRLEHIINEPRKKAGGVHFDPKIEGHMVLIEGMLGFAQSQKGRLSYKDYIVAIGEYVHKEISSQLMGDLGNGYLSEGNIKKAESFYRNALRINLKTKSLQGQSEQLNRLSCVSSKNSNFTKSINLCKKALVISKSINLDNITLLTNNLAIYYLNKSINEFDNGRLKYAIKLHKNGLEYSKVNNDILHEVIYLSNLSSFYLYDGNHKKSIAIALLLIYCNEIMIESVKPSEMPSIRKSISRVIINLAYIRKFNHNYYKLINTIKQNLNKILKDATGQFYEIESPTNDELIQLSHIMDKVPEKSLRIDYPILREDTT